VLDDDAWRSNGPKSGGTHHQKPDTDTDADTIERARRHKPVRVGGGGGIECGAAHKTGQRRHKQDWWGPHGSTKTVDLTCHLAARPTHKHALTLALLTTNATPSLAHHSGGFLPGSKAFAKVH